MTRHMFTPTDICHIIGMGGRGEGLPWRYFYLIKKLTQFFRFQKCSIWRLEKVMWRCKRNVINYDAKSNMVKPKENSESIDVHMKKHPDNKSKRLNVPIIDASTRSTRNQGKTLFLNKCEK